MCVCGRAGGNGRKRAAQQNIHTSMWGKNIKPLAIESMQFDINLDQELKEERERERDGDA